MKHYIYDGTKYVLHEDVVGLSELPTPSAKYLDKAFLLTADQTGFTKGVIYECHEVTPATDPKTYEWVAVTTEANGMYKVYSGTYDSVEGEFYDDEGNALPKVNMQQYYDIATRTTWIYITTSDTFFRIFSDVVNMGAAEMISPLIKSSYPEMKAAELRCMNVYGNDGGLIEGFIYKLDRISVTPEAGDSPVDEGWWEVDSTTGKMIQTEDTTVVSGKLYFDYVWTQVKTQQSVFPGTLDEWDALTPAEQAQYDFIASPEEASDKDTGWLNVGNQGCKYRVKNGFCTFVLNISSNILFDHNGNVALDGTLPSTATPSFSLNTPIYMYGYSGSDETWIRNQVALHINPNGELSLTGGIVDASIDTAKAVITYPVG